MPWASRSHWAWLVLLGKSRVSREAPPEDYNDEAEVTMDRTTGQTPTVTEPKPGMRVPDKNGPDVGSKPDLKNPSTPEAGRPTDWPLPDMDPPGMDDGVSDTPAPSGHTSKGRTTARG
jgi:hypothetical protein